MRNALRGAPLIIFCERIALPRQYPQGHVDAKNLWFVPRHVERVKDAATETVREIEDIVEGQYAAIYRDHPFLQPSDQVHWLRRMLENQEIRAALHLT